MAVDKVDEVVTWARYEKLNSSFPDDWIKMYVVTYHNGFPEPHGENRNLFKRPGFTARVDWYDGDLDRYMGYLEIEDTEEIKDKAWQKYLGSTGIYSMTGGGFKLWEEEVGRHGTVYELSGSAQKIKAYVTKWISRIKLLHEKDSKVKYWNGGDDSYYDYAPDEVALIYQVCKALGAKKLYEDFLEWVTTVAYKDREDNDPSFPNWDGV